MAFEGIDKGTDLSYVHTTARIAIYDDLLSSPRIIDIQPDSTREFINKLATEIYNQAKQAGGLIPYTVILQVSENFIHAHFNEMVVSIFDRGNTIRFTDQGPGINDKIKAQQPGYSSATKEMKAYINGVGSGLPIVKEYLETKHGTVQIEDNLNHGAVVTLSLSHKSVVNTADQVVSSPQEGIQTDENTSLINHKRRATPSNILTSLSKRATILLPFFNSRDIWGVKDLAEESQIPLSTTLSELRKMEEAGIVTRLGKKWILTDIGTEALDFL